MKNADLAFARAPVQVSDDAYYARQLDAHRLGYADTLVAHFVGADPMDRACC